MSIIDQIKQKPSLNDDLWQEKIVQKKIKSQFHHLYKQFIQPITVDHHKIEEAFQRSKISYNYNEPYQKFHFDVEKAIPSFPFYRVNVKLAHFSLQLSVFRSKQKNLNFKDRPSQKGVYGQVYFLTFGNQELCVKSIAYDPNTNFQKMFAMTVKEYSILKICSALECAPYIDNFFGFNIFVYDDCIEYAMERGKVKPEMSPSRAKELTDELALMHQYKIIHMDIKLENVVWSQHYQKAVFIDFGFSQIIKEQLGMKTLSVFRGTLSNTSPQMTELMMNGSGYIDLYYNDMFGLKITLTPQKRMIVEQNEQQLLKTKQECILEKEQLSIFLFYRFQYYYLTQNLAKCSSSIKTYFQFEGSSIKNIFSFIKSILKDFFLPQLFYSELKQFKDITIYKQIQQIQKLGSQTHFNRIYKHTGNEFDGQNNPQIQHIQSLLISNFDLEYSSSYSNYARLIAQLKMLELDNAFNFISIAFQSIRFDMKNLNLTDKLQIAIKMNELMKRFIKNNQFQVSNMEEYQQNSQNLNEIRIFFIYCLHICLNTNPNSWIQAHLFDIFQQMILVNVNYFPYIDLLLSYSCKHAKSYQERTLLLLYVSRIISIIPMIQHRYLQNIHSIQQKFMTFYKEQKKRLLERNFQSSNFEDLSIQKILRIAKSQYEHNWNRFEQLLEYLKEVKNVRIRKYLLYFITIEKMNNIFYYRPLGQLFKIGYFIKNSSDLRNIQFLLYCNLYLKLFLMQRNHLGELSYMRYMSSVINCKEIEASFTMYEKIVSTNCDSYQIKKMIQKIVIFYPYSNHIRTRLIIDKLAEIVELIKNLDITITPQLIKQLVQLYKIYKQSNDNTSEEIKKTISEFEAAYYKIQIEFFFYSICKQTKGLFVEHFQQIITKKQQMDKLDINKHSYEITFYHFCLLRYQYLILVSRELYEESIKIINQFVNINLILHNTMMALESLKNLVHLVFKVKDPSILIQPFCDLYKLCKQQNFISYYLMAPSVNLLYTTFIMFAEKRRDYFYDLLVCLVEFLIKNPENSLIQRLIFAINQFFKLDPYHASMLHFSKITESPWESVRNNPYYLLYYGYSLRNENGESQMKLLRVIADNIGRLSEFAKVKLLCQYYGVHLSMEKRNLRRRIYIFRQAKRYLKDQKLKRKVQKSLIILRIKKQLSIVFQLKIKKQIKIFSQKLFQKLTK